MTTNSVSPGRRPPIAPLATLIIAFAVSAPASSANQAVRADKQLPVVVEQLVPPPAVPDHEQIASGPPEIVRVRLTIEEKRIEPTPGAAMWAFTFNGSVPGPLIIAHQNDYLELTLVNPAANMQLHNVDFHAALGGHGGAALTLVAPGQQATIRFKLTSAGVFVYHCAPGGAMTPLHVASGMSGAIMVLPRDGLKDANGRTVHYDRAYYIGEQDFYLPRNADGSFKQYATAGENFGDLLPLLTRQIPDLVVYNGKVGALTGDHALTAAVGEKVLFIHSQADRDTRVHLIGGIGDLVWVGGSFANPPARDLQTWRVPAGSAVAALHEFREPGDYTYTNHDLTEGYLLGAAATVHVEGEWNDDLMRQVSKPGPIASRAQGSHT